MEVINLNLIPTGALPVVHASQYDEGRTFRANLMDGSTVYTLDGTETLECDVKKPDGNIVTVAVTNTSDSYVEIDTTLQMCACAGESLAELHITKGAQEIGTLNFILAVERSPLEGGIASQSEIDNLATQVAGLVATEVANQYDSANVVFDDEPTEGHGIPYTVTSEGIGNAIDNALDMTDTASGAIATFDTSLALPLQDCTIAINAVQEGTGTPSPDNVRPISGFNSGVITRCGVNLWDEEWKNGYYSPLNGGYVADEHYICSKNLIKVLPSTQYYIHSDNSILLEVLEYRKNGTFIGALSKNIANQIITTSNDCAYIHIGTHNSDVITTYTSGISINYPSTDTDYHAYNGTTVTISLGQTVYGGSLDVTSGVLTVTWAIDTFNSFDLMAYERNGYKMANTLSHTPKLAYGNCLCNCFTRATSYTEATGDVQNSIGYNNNGVILLNYYTGGSYVQDIATLNSALPTGGCKIAYELATPITIQLTPTEISAIVGTNNVFTDTNGDTTLEYYTKRGEQTVRIAEGVAVDVINNKNIDNLTTTNKTLVGAVNEVNKKFGKLPTEIRCGISNYSGLKGGGHANRVNVPITFSTPMTGIQYAVFIVVSDAYSDYPYVQGYCFGGSRTANGFTATIVSMSSDTTTQVNGSFYWVAVRYK